MDRSHLVILLGLLATANVLAEAYTWTDDEGIVHYSDRPAPGAVEIELSESRPLRPQAAPRRARTADNPAAPAPFEYQTLEINRPASEETLWNIEEVLDVSLSLSPSLRPGHRLQIYLDGTPRVVSGMSFQLRDVYRGAHSLQAEVIDERGNRIIRSRASRFYVRQNSVL